MTKGLTEHAQARREEIINACLELYKNFNFKDITIKDISEYTSFSRPSIYNYFETKEEIFLAIFQKEYELWKEDLDNIGASKKKLTVNQFAKLVSKSLEKRYLLLKLLSMNLYDIEEHCRIERLVDFKKAYGSSKEAFIAALKRSLPNFTNAKCEQFLYIFLPFMIGIYPFSSHTNKQCKALKKAGVKFRDRSIYELSYNTIIKLLE